MFEIQSQYLSIISFMLEKYLFSNIAPLLKICEYTNNGDYFMQMNAIIVKYGGNLYTIFGCY